jgi:hypothetical protein
VSWAAVTAIGTVLGGLALPLAFIQLAALRQDRLRTQVSRVGAWVGEPERTGEAPGLWKVPVLIRNSSELPVQIDALDVVIRVGGRVLHVGTLSPLERIRELERIKGETERFVPSVSLGPIAPGDTRSFDNSYEVRDEVKAVLGEPRPFAGITRIVITDAAHHQWELGSGRAGPARRVRWWRRRWWKRDENYDFYRFSGRRGG